MEYPDLFLGKPLYKMGVHNPVVNISPANPQPSSLVGDFSLSVSLEVGFDEILG